MKRIAIFILLICMAFGINAQNKGDSLAILYYKVWAYKNPDSLSTRLGPYSYLNKNKMVFQGLDEKYSDYYKVITPDKKIAFVKTDRVSIDKSLSHRQIQEEVHSGKRQKKVHDYFNYVHLDIPNWVGIVIFIAILAGLYFLWKYFYKIDRYFCLKQWPVAPLLKNPWFITTSVILGFISGAMEQFIAPTETIWFYQEGIRLWADYPSFWDWVLWVDSLAFALVLIASVVHAFIRFKTKIAIIYSVISVLLVIVYFIIGAVTGGIALIIFLLYLFTQGSSGGEGDMPQTLNANGKTYRHTYGNNYEEI